ncbi:MAG: FAD-binding oxidoreductase [Gemmatimonadales bacterium]|nr:FAD-binding oxidoreductase [Gemmatimonadales bacterium]
MLTRREFLEVGTKAGVVASGWPWRRDWPQAGATVNDIHSQLNPTHVHRVVRVDSHEAVRAAVRAARAERRGLSIAGGRHSMGGQQFGTGTILLDTRPMNRILNLDQANGVLEVEAGIQWPELIDGYLRLQQGRPQQWGIAQKQTGADRLSVGGALASNVHGRGLRMKPFVGDVESFRLVGADGVVRTCSRSENAELFRLVIGGYGLFGVVYSARLRLTPRRKVERVVEVRGVDDLSAAFEQRIADGYLYGDFQFETDDTSDTFLTRGVFACYRPVDPSTPIPPSQAALSADDWIGLLYLAHADKAAAFRRYSQHYLSTSGQIYWTDTNQLGYYAEEYHLALDRRLGASVPATEMITELYVPRGDLAAFLREAAQELRRSAAPVIYGTIRLIERDDETFLPWAKDRFACIVLNLHVDHSSQGLERSQRAFRGLIDLARGKGGSYFLTYHRWATREQLEACYPQFREFLRLKRQYDPEGVFQSDWYRHYEAMFGGR